MKLKFLTLQNWLLGALLGALGFGGCHSAKRTALVEPERVEEPAPKSATDTIPKPQPRPRDEMMLMYGVPTVEYHVSGRVVSPNGKPVANAEVMILDEGIEATEDTIYGNPAYIERYARRNAVRTDKDGRFNAKASFTPKRNVQVLVRDVDGSDNGSYRHKVVDVTNEMNDIDTSKRDGWKIGEAGTEVEIKLEEKQQ